MLFLYFCFLVVVVIVFNVYYYFWNFVMYKGVFMRLLFVFFFIVLVVIYVFFCFWYILFGGLLSSEEIDVYVECFVVIGVDEVGL